MNLERRVTRLEEHVGLGQPEPPTRTTRRPKSKRRVARKRRPRRTRPAQGEVTFPLLWVGRDGTPHEHRMVMADGAYTERVMDGVAFRLYAQKCGDLNAHMITFAAINGYSGRGHAYFRELHFEVPGNDPLDTKGKHVIPPRRAIIRRYWLGEDAEEAAEWGWVNDPRPAPAWAPAESERALMKPPALSIGPYDHMWGFTNIGNSHGGQGVGPFHGGPEDWNTCPEGRVLREHEMLLEMQRPVWILGDLPDEPYWMGQTPANRLSGYNEEPDGWCPYAEKLHNTMGADHFHLRRGTGGPFALAQWDLFARDCALNFFRDFKVAHRLDVRDDGAYHLLKPLPVKIEQTVGHLNSEGDRGLAHILCLLRWLRPYVSPRELKPYEDLYREWVRKMADPMYGYTRSSTPIHGGAHPLIAPYGHVFHDQLVLYEMKRFGGLDDVADRLSRFLTNDPPKFYETREGRERDTVRNRNSVGDGHWSYSAMTHGVLHEFDSVEDLLHDMAYRGANGSSQDLDAIPREIWEAGL